MNDKIERKEFDKERGIVLTWDKHGNTFVSMPVNNIPLKQFEDWMKECNKDYSGKRWDMITMNHHKAKSYDALMMTIPEEDNIPEDTNINPDGLLNGGIEENGTK